MAIRVLRSPADFETAAPALVRALDDQPGMFFRSGTETPGRYARWDLGLVAPAVILRSKDRALWLEAQDEQQENGK